MPKARLSPTVQEGRREILVNKFYSISSDAHCLNINLFLADRYLERYTYQLTIS
jgi:hypothetical protein